MDLGMTVRLEFAKKRPTLFTVILTNGTVHFNFVLMDRFSILFFVVIGFVSLAHCSTLYVDSTTGVDTAAGTLAAPLQTITKGT
jgi:hypothetical protein